MNGMLCEGEPNIDVNIHVSLPFCGLDIGWVCPLYVSSLQCLSLTMLETPMNPH
jgi:hypothetical protein